MEGRCPATASMHHQNNKQQQRQPGHPNEMRQSDPIACQAPTPMSNTPTYLLTGAQPIEPTVEIFFPSPSCIPAWGSLWHSFRLANLGRPRRLDSLMLRFSRLSTNGATPVSMITAPLVHRIPPSLSIGQTNQAATGLSNR
jgi:hypothetical protein